MGLLEKVKDRLRDNDDGEAERPQEKVAPEPHRELTDEERARLIEEAREDLPKLDKQVEENLLRLKGLSRS